jgi:hypothetical protein
VSRHKTRRPSASSAHPLVCRPSHEFDRNLRSAGLTAAEQKVHLLTNGHHFSLFSSPLVPLFPLLVGASVSRKKLRSNGWQHPSRDLVPRSGLIKPTKTNGNIHLIGRMNDDERTFRRLLFGRLFFRCAPIQSRHFGWQLRLTLRAADGRSPPVPKLLHPNENRVNDFQVQNKIKMSLIGRRLFNCIEWTEVFPRRKTKKVPTSLKQFQKAEQKEKNLGSRDRMRQVYHDFFRWGGHTRRNKQIKIKMYTMTGASIGTTASQHHHHRRNTSIPK